MSGHGRVSRGQSTVELALLLPFLLWISVGVVDFGRVYYYDVVAINAARTGARVAADLRKSDDAVRQAVKQDAPSLALSDADIAIEVSPPGPRSSGDTVTVRVAYSFEPLTPLVAALFPGGRVPISRSASMVVF
ncbi:MAG: TadE/TadG family type IV pilus assembly protein [Sphingomonadaceae bacterium]